MLLLAGYDGTQPFQDPFCGSGTIAIEAAWIATRRAPGLMRRFGFEKLKNFDAALWKKLQHEAETQIRPAPAPISGSDNDRHMIRAAVANAQAAEVDTFVRFEVKDAQDTRPNGEGGILISNPPCSDRKSVV